MLITIVLTAAATLAIVLVVLNLGTGEKLVEHCIEHLFGIRDERFLHRMGVLLGPPVIGGNRCRLLLNGDRIFPSMLEAIRHAKKTVDFETYIYWSGDIGLRFADALSDRARHGVQVHVMLDWVGTKRMDKGILELMSNAGVVVERYNKPSWTGLGRLNHRTHRKLLIVDGEIGFTGGVGIATEWTGDAQDPDHWRDSHFRIEGPAVAQMQAVFMDNWIKTTGAVLYDDDYFPELEGVGDEWAHVFMSSSSGGIASMELMYLMAITSAKQTLRLSSSYFVPNRITIGALLAAIDRGVRVQVVTPGRHADSFIVREASRGTWGALLQGGVEIYQFRPTMYHVKVLIVDDYMVSVGSTNFDDRSFRLNDEANLNIYDDAFAQEQIAVFEADIARSTRVTHAAWRARSWREKALEKIVSVLDPQL